ncbi:MAG: hypothetical protein AB1714_04895 [Acidobacteriota bacterium]
MTQRARFRWIAPLTILGILTAVDGALARPSAVPSLVGQWKIVGMTGANYEDVSDVNSTPEFVSGAPADALIVITGQKAGAFAGYLTVEGEKLLLTGVIGNDNSVIMQFASGNSRHLFSGKYSVAGKKKQIKGSYHGYEEFTASIPSMSNGSMELEKK